MKQHWSVNKDSNKVMTYPWLIFGKTGNSVNLQVRNLKWTANASLNIKTGKLFWTGASLPSNMCSVWKFCALLFPLKFTTGKIKSGVCGLTRSC